MKKFFKKIIYNLKTREIIRTYETWKNAMVQGDCTSIDNICDEHFLWTSFRKVTSNKKETLNKITSGNLHYVSWTNECININVVGNVATIRTKEILDMVVYGQRVNVTQDVIILLVKQDKKWKLAGGQETESDVVLRY